MQEKGARIARQHWHGARSHPLTVEVMEGADAIVRIQRIVHHAVRILAWVQGGGMNVTPGAVPPPLPPGTVPPPRPTVGGILRDSILAVHRLVTHTAEEITEAAMNRVRRVVISVVVSIALVIAALVAYVMMLGEVVAVLSDLGCHPLWRLLALLVLFAVPCVWLITMVRSWHDLPRRQLKLDSPTALTPDPTTIPR